MVTLPTCGRAASCVLALWIVAASIPGCSRDESPRGVVIVLVDELRRDSADRYLRRVNELAARGVIVEGMHSAAPWTYPSVVSLLSGLYPQQHGADARHQDKALSHFDAAVPLIQRTLSEAGFATAAFITNPFLLDWNELHRGFDVFESDFIGSQGAQWGFRKAWVRPTMYGDSVNEAIRRHFSAPATGPEFTYVHYIDVHGPWDEAPFPADYASAIRFIDERIAELYAFLVDRYDGNLLFIVTADHGRALGNDLYVGSGFHWRANKLSVHEFNLRIPFLILPGRDVPAGRRVSGPASNIDVVPTLLDWLGLKSQVPLPGLSLLPAILNGEPLDPDRVVYARTSGFGHANDGILYRGRKYLRHFDPRTGWVTARRVFDLREDPGEERALESGFGPAEQLLREAASDHGLHFEAEFKALDPETVEQLQALGYFRDPDAPVSPPPDARRRGRY